MLISFFNASDLIGCGGDINQSEWGTWRGTLRGYAERVRGGGMQREYVEGVCRGGMRRGMQRGTQRGYTEGYVEGVHRGGMWRGYAEEVCG